MHPGPERRRFPRAQIGARATVLRGEVKVGDYLVENLSAGGALLTCGPPIAMHAVVRVLVKPFGAPTLSLEAMVQRSTDGGVAVAFRHVATPVQDWIQRAVLESLSKQQRGSILVVDDEPARLVSLAEALRACGRWPILARTSLDAIRWLGDLDVKVEAALVERSFEGGDADGMLALLGEDHPEVRRVLVAARDAGLPATRTGVHALLTRPWTREDVRWALKAAFAPSSRGLTSRVVRVTASSTAPPAA